MAAAVACRRAVRLGTGSTRIQLICPNRFQSRHISELLKSNGKRLFLVDTLALVRRLEAQGVPSKQAEAITAAMTEVLNDSLENVSYSFVSKGEMQKNEMTQDSNLSKFKTEVKSSQVDVTDVIEGHSSYLWCTQQILEDLELDTYYPVFNQSVSKS